MNSYIPPFIRSKKHKIDTILPDDDKFKGVIVINQKRLSCIDFSYRAESSRHSFSSPTGTTYLWPDKPMGNPQVTGYFTIMPDKFLWELAQYVRCVYDLRIITKTNITKIAKAVITHIRDTNEDSQTYHFVADNAERELRSDT